jgi:hypothetical protein
MNTLRSTPLPVQVQQQRPHSAQHGMIYDNHDYMNMSRLVNPYETQGTDELQLSISNSYN